MIFMSINCVVTFITVLTNKYCHAGNLPCIFLEWLGTAIPRTISIYTSLSLGGPRSPSSSHPLTSDIYLKSVSLLCQLKKFEAGAVSPQSVVPMLLLQRVCTVAALNLCLRDPFRRAQTFLTSNSMVLLDRIKLSTEGYEASVISLN